MRPILSSLSLPALTKAFQEACSSAATRTRNITDEVTAWIRTFSAAELGEGSNASEDQSSLSEMVGKNSTRTIRESESYMKQSAKLFVVQSEHAGLHFLQNLYIDLGQRDGIQ